MGYQIGGAFLLNYPWVAVGYVKGNVDLEFYNNKLDTITADAAGGVVAWAFIALGEFCDLDGTEGYQQGGADFIINYFTGPQGSLYASDGSTYLDGSGNPIYQASVQSFFGNFNNSCRIAPRGTIHNSHTIGQYDFKCDITIDYTGLWEANATKINNCLDTNRKIGLLLDVVGAAFDVNVAATNLNSAGQNTMDGNQIHFNVGKLRFAWDNYFNPGASKTSIQAQKLEVVAAYLKDDSASVSYKGATTAQQIIFSFAQPKSANLNVFQWDPTFSVLDQASGTSIFAMFGLLSFLLFIHFF
jgi:hypothetical protein